MYTYNSYKRGRRRFWLTHERSINYSFPGWKILKHEYVEHGPYDSTHKATGHYFLSVDGKIYDRKIAVLAPSIDELSMTQIPAKRYLPEHPYFLDETESGFQLRRRVNRIESLRSYSRTLEEELSSTP